jgi:uncharacterized protein
MKKTNDFKNTTTAFITAVSLSLASTMAIAAVYKGVAAANRQDYATALKEFKESAEQGDAFAQYDLGWMYANGRGVVKNERTAVEWYTKAAEQGNAAAQNNLGLMYDFGKGVVKNERTAVEWYTKAAEQGAAGAQYNLGAMYANGEGVVKNERTAVEWYKLIHLNFSDSISG